ncbi:MAG: hypothetical protein M3N16_01135 [Actinomycetota bacterium]|nr:hypothetical protein [Actinomycetota bacterium]
MTTGRVCGRGRAGRDFDAPDAFVWEVRDGKTVRVAAYPDTATLIEAVDPSDASAAPPDRALGRECAVD